MLEAEYILHEMLFYEVVKVLILCAFSLMAFALYTYLHEDKFIKWENKILRRVFRRINSMRRFVRRVIDFYTPDYKKELRRRDVPEMIRILEEETGK